MADPDAQLAAAPSAFAFAAGAQRSAAAQLRAATPVSFDAAAAGDAACADALSAAIGALSTVGRVCAEGLDELAAALTRAGYAYDASESSAVPR